MTTEPMTRRQAARAREDAAPHLNLPDLERIRNRANAEPLELGGDWGANAEVEHYNEENKDTPGFVTLYRKVEWGWTPMPVPQGSVVACLASGSFREECGDCGGHCGLDPNSCPGRAKVAFRRCPVCRKALYDLPDSTLIGPEIEGEHADDPMEIKEELYSASTPEQRTLIKLENHISTFHPAEASRRALLAAGRPVHEPTVRPQPVSGETDGQ